MKKYLENKFIHYCDSENFEINQNQIYVINKLEDYYKKNFKSFFSRLFKKKYQKKGFYLYGDVGVGKTMILNFFFDHLDKRKLRKHFNEFMLNFHDIHERKEKMKKI